MYPSKKIFFGRLCLAFVIALLMAIGNIRAQIKPNPEAQSVSDSSLVLELIEKGKKVLDTEPDQALLFYNEALNKSKTINYATGVVMAATKISAWYYGSNIDKTIAEAHYAAGVYDKAGLSNTELMADIHLTLAEAYDEQGKQDSSAYYYYVLSQEMETGKINNPNLAINLFTKLAIFWINMDYGTADNEAFVTTLSSYVAKAQNAAKQIQDSADAVSSIYFLQGAYYHAFKKFDSARYFYLEYLMKREAMNKLSIPRKISTLTNITDTYLRQDKPVEALKYIGMVQEMGKMPGLSKYIVFYLTITDLLKANALYQLKQYRPAITLIDSTLAKLKTTGGHLRGEVVEAYKISADSYKALGEFKKALEFDSLYIKLNDSLMKKEKVDMVKRLEVRYRIAEKDKELVEQKLTITEVQSKVRARNIFIVAISLLAIFGSSIFTLWRRKNIHKQKLQQERINNFQKEMEIESLSATLAGEEKERNRIAKELHDGIGGLLAAAKMNFEMGKKESNAQKIPDYNLGIKLLEEASIELRKTAHNMMPEILLQNGIASAVRHFCKNIGANSATNFAFQLYGPELRFEKTFELSVYRIVQELVHNIVKHAKATTAVVQMSFQPDGGLDITVEDNGVGLPNDAMEKSDGMGLKSIAGRTKTLNGKLDIQSTEGNGTSMYIEFEAPPHI